MREFSGQRVYEFENFRLDADHLLLFRGPEQLTLTPKVVETLLALVERRGEVVSKDELMSAVWPDTIVEESNLSQNLYLLRKTLGSTSQGKPFIETLRRRGYRFSPEVRVVENHFKTPESARAVNIERSDNIYSVVDWQRRSEGAVVEPPRSPMSLARTWGGTIAILAAFVVGAAIILGVYRFGGGNQRKYGDVAAVPFSEMNIARLTTSGKTKRAAISPDGRYVAHVTEDPEGSNLWVRQVTGTTDVRITGPSESQYVWVAFAPDGNSVYYLRLDRDKGDTELYRVPVLGGPAVKAANDTGPVGFSPDGTSMVFIRGYMEESRVIVSGIDGSNERILATRRQPEYFLINWYAPSWSPDGQTIACPVRLADERGHYETVLAINTEDGAERRLTSRRWQQVGQPQWLADALVLTAAERSTGPQQIWHITPDGTATRVTHDLNDYYDLSLTADGARLAAVQINAISNVWVVPVGDESRAKQIASEVGRVEGIAWTPDGRIVYRSSAGDGTEIWVVNADGSDARQLTVGARAGHGLAVTPDGRQIIFASDRAGRSNIWRVDADGSNFKQLTSGDGEFYPAGTPDGQWVIYQSAEIEPRLWKVPIDGGNPIQMTTTRASRPDVSPDGKLVAYHYLDPKFEKSRWSIGVVSSTGGERIVRYDLPPTVSRRYVRWSPDGRSIAYANDPDDLSDLWLQPIDGGSPRRLTDFKSDHILTFDWSTDGRTLALVRIIETSDVVLISKTGVK